jgi:Lipocalin-like domain
MRSIALSLAIVIAAAMGLQAYAEDKPGSLEGAWELVDAKNVPADPSFSLTKTRQIKILTKTHWAFLGQDRLPAKTKPSAAELTAAGKSFSAGGGTYKLEGDSYTEHIEFFVVPKFVGTSITFKIKWQGDEWIQTGTLPLKALGLSDHDVQITEKYRRIK